MSKAANDEGPLSPLSVTAADLHAYVAGGLTGERRREVEGLLACNPDLAAQVMTQLHLGGGAEARRKPRQARLASGLAVALALALGSGLGWVAAERGELEGWRASDGATPPKYVEEAAESREAARIREGMISQPASRLDAAEIRRTLRVSLPSLPSDWRVKDVQVFPTDSGPAVNLVAEAAGRRVELFAVRAKTAATVRPRIAIRGPEAVAYWERGDDAYVLSGPQSRRELMSAAVALASGADL
jgi:anti-sigma factor RsiW